MISERFRDDVSLRLQSFDIQLRSQDLCIATKSQEQKENMEAAVKDASKRSSKHVHDLVKKLAGIESEVQKTTVSISTALTNQEKTVHLLKKEIEDM